ACQVAAGWRVHLLSPRRRISGGQRAWRSLRESSPAVFSRYPALPVPGPDPSLEVATSRAAVAECRGLGRHPGRHRPPCADVAALTGTRTISLPRYRREVDPGRRGGCARLPPLTSCWCAEA